MLRTVRFFLAFSILAGVASMAQAAATLTVTGTGEPAALDTDDCTGTSCATLRGAINHAQSGDTISFAPALDGATISLTLYTNCLSTTDTLGATCLPQISEWASAGYVTQFGPSAFYIPRNFTLTIDAATGLSHGLSIMRASGATNFRLFDVGVGATLNLSGLRLSNGHAEGGHSTLGGGALGAGGAIFNQGSLNLKQSTLGGNVAQGGNNGNGIVYGLGGGGAGQDALANGGGPNGGAADIENNRDASGSPGSFGGGGGEGTSSGSSPSAGNGGSGGFGGGGGYGQGRPGVGGVGGFGGGGGGGENYGGLGGFGGGGPDNAAGGGGGMGGAIFNDAGSIYLTNVTLGGNSATGGSPGGSGYGGAIFNYAGSLSANFVTASGNSVAAGTGASADGGAIYSLGDAACAGGGNTCNTGGNATLMIANSIMANSNGGADITTNTINGGTSSYTPSASTLTGTLSIGSLASGGGLEAVMMPPAGINTIVNAVACTGAPAIDQRGVTRPQQGLQCDIGAVERKAIEDMIFLDGFEGN